MKENNFINHNLRYSHLWNHRIDSSTEALCLGEFIDNSISSYLETSDDFSGIEGCRIKITIDETDVNNLRIEILDNANGMNEDCLDKASIEYNVTHEEKSKNKLNQYFIGMKFAIFWLGRNGKIWSKSKNNNEYFLDYNAMEKKQSDVVMTKSIVSNDNCIKTNTGTKIVIDHLWNETGFKRKFTEEKMKQIIETLSFRYFKYIADGLVIYFNKKTSDEPEEKLIKKIDKASIQDNNIFNTKGFKKKNLFVKKNNENKIDDQVMEKVEKAIKEFGEKINNNKSIDNKLYNELLNKLKLNETITFTETINLNNNNIKVNLCFLQKPEIKYCGIAILHENRFIKHPIFDRKIPHSGNQLFYRNISKDDGIWKWIYGELDISNEKIIGIKPDKNKSEIILDDELKDKWESDWRTIIGKYKFFIKFLQELVTLPTIKTEKMQREDIDKAKNVDPNLKSINVIDGTPNLKYSTNNENENIISKYKIGDVEVILSPNNDLEKDFSYEQAENKNIFKFQYNPNSVLLKSEKINEFSLIRLISLLQIIWEGDNIKSECSLIDIINDILGNDNES